MKPSYLKAFTIRFFKYRLDMMMIKRSKSIKTGQGITIASFIAVICYVASLSFPFALYAQESSCVECHTSMKKLIEITRAIEAAKPKVKKSEETKGEG